MEISKLVVTLFLAFGSYTLSLSAPSDVQITKLTGTVASDTGSTLHGASIYLVATDKAPMFIGGQPSIEKLEQLAIASCQAGMEGRFTILADMSAPRYLYIAAPGRKTVNVYLPRMTRSALELSAVLFEADFKRDERIPTVKTSDSIANLFITVYALSSVSTNSDVKRQMDSSINYQIKHGSLQGFNYDLTAHYNKMLTIYRLTDDRDLKNYVLLNLSFLCVGEKYPVEEKYLIEALANTPPSDPVWLAEGGAFVRGVYFGLGTFKKHKAELLPFMEGLVDQCPVEEMKPLQLYSLLYYANTCELPQAANYYAKLLNDYPTSPQATNAIKRFLRKVRLSTGQKLPWFEVKDVDHTGQFITDRTTLGKITLIDLWATWCGPCVKQLPELDSAYRRYLANDFAIISISLDRAMDDVATFRNKKWKMPWINGFVGQERQKFMDDFEIFGIPHLILVDRAGNIITANQNLLSGPNLDQTLKKYLQ